MNSLMLAAAFVALAAVLATIIRTMLQLQGFRVYVSHPFGFLSTTVGGAEREVLTPVSADRCGRILQEFIEGDLFDGLYVTLCPGSWGGVTLTNEGGQIEMTCSFLRLKHPDRVISFRDEMRRLGYAPHDEDTWNVGLGEDRESVSLNYRTAIDFELVRDMTQHALELCDGEFRDGDSGDGERRGGEPEEEVSHEDVGEELIGEKPRPDFFVQAWRSQDGPSRIGIRIVRLTDPLDQIP